MQAMGNEKAKRIYQGKMPRDVRPPTEQSSIKEKERWIRDKYERKLYFVQDGGNEEEEKEEKVRKPKSKTKVKEVKAPVKKIVQPPVDFFGFDDEVPTPATTTTTKPVDEWADFQGSSSQQISSTATPSSGM